jgi:ATP-dependent protease ClpP protease subunit
MLKRHAAKVCVTIDGLAASIASVIAMAGDEVVMPDNSFMMIHDPTGVVVGTSADMRQLAESLDKVKDSLVGVYVDKTRRPRDEIEQLMATESWLTAAEAKDKGFADRVDGKPKDDDAAPFPFGMPGFSAIAASPGFQAAQQRQAHGKVWDKAVAKVNSRIPG